MKRINFILPAFLLLTACADDLTPINGQEEIFQTGELVQFTTMVPRVRNTRAAYADWEAEQNSYKAVNYNYTLNVEMWKEGDPHAAGSATYKPMQYRTDDPRFPGSDPIPHDGTLEPESGENNAPLYWLDNSNKWGFKATAGTETLQSDQRDATKWLAQDRLEGYGYLPIWDQEKSTQDGYNGEYQIGALNYRTSREWYQDNKSAQTLSGLMVSEGSNGEEYKKIPLYMQHKRSWITLILKAGEGVRREALYYATSANNIKTHILSYHTNADGSKGDVEIEYPWSSEYKIDYETHDTNGAPQNNVSTTRYDAIVDAYNYAENPQKSIASITLSTQQFLFSADCDARYIRHGNSPEDEEYKTWYDSYDLSQGGKHLTIIATLSRETRKILITAHVEDWTEAITQTICDDYGNNGDPIVIQNKEQLVTFLSGSDNKAGTIAIIQPRNLDLDEDGDWSSEDYTLNATLNVAGAKIKTKEQFLSSISASGSIINGTFEMVGSTPVVSAIANTNEGMLERVVVTNPTGAAQATKGGLVDINYGTIYKCSSSLPVYGTKPGDSSAETPYFVGGIAAQSIYKEAALRPVIDACIVNASVNGGPGVKGGGMAGEAAGSIANCTFEYGITFSQSSDNFKNIFVSMPNNANQNMNLLSATNNAWPTTATNPVRTDIPNDNGYAKKYDAVIDSETELGMLLASANNSENKSYRISNSFAVNSATWQHGKQTDEVNTSTGDCSGNVYFKLYGNDKTITLTGTEGNANSTVTLTDGDAPDTGIQTATYTSSTMLFSNILGEVCDLTIHLDKPLVAKPSVIADGENAGKYNANDAVAPLAYALYGPTALISNVHVTSAEGTFIQSATPAGLVVWARGGNNGTKQYPTIENCTVEADVRMWLNYNYSSSTARQYAGGIVACASVAQITECMYHGKTEFTLEGAVKDTDSETYPANKGNCYYGGIVGGTTSKDTPKSAYLIISDCSSWYSTSVDSSNKSKGSIIGTARYSTSDSSSTMANGMSEDTNHGNWWTGKGVADLAEGCTEEKAIGANDTGKTPTFPSSVSNK